MKNTRKATPQQPSPKNTFTFHITTLDGEVITATLLDVGSAYPDADVLYIEGVPCRLSTATPVINAMPELLAVAKQALDWFYAYEFGVLDKPSCEGIYHQLDDVIAAADPDFVC